jgi:FG-GAP-like repeat
MMPALGRSIVSSRPPWCEVMLLAVICLLLLALPSLPARAGNPSFATRRTFGPDADSTASIIVGDMDRDGDLDLIVGNRSELSAAYLNDGKGSFYNGPIVCGTTARVHCIDTAADDTRSMALGDLDGDGDLDLVAGNYQTQSTVYLNTGADRFSIERRFGSAAPTESVAVGDVDGDGDLDLVAGNRQTESVVYLNDGAGNFRDEHRFGAASDGTESIALGDLDGDSDLDLVAGNRQYYSSGCLCYIGGPSIAYLNDGAGKFLIKRSLVGAVSTRDYQDVALGDVDGDGDLDVIAGTNIYLNDGVGNFSQYRTFSDQVDVVALGDVDGDGDLDIVAGSWGKNVVHLNDGAGNFPIQIPFGAGVFATASVALADLDNDTDLDLVIGGWNEQNAVYLNDGLGDFPAGQVLHSALDYTKSVAEGDVNGDGSLDLVIGNAGRPLEIYLNDRAGHFTNSSSFGASGDAVALADMDQDGDLEVITDDAVYRNDGSAQFSQHYTFGSDSGVMTVGDVDGDGDLDIVTDRFLYLNDSVGSEFSFLERAFGTQQGFVEGLALGDTDRDGDLDIVIGTFDGQNRIFLNDGEANFYRGPATCAASQGVRCFGTGSDNSRSLSLGDVDGDGDLDIVVGNWSERNVVYLNDGAGNFYNGLITCGVTTGVRCFGAEMNSTEGLALGDMDGDGDLDVVAGNYVDSIAKNGQNIIYVNDGAGYFADGRPFGTGSNKTMSVAVGDIDSDGDLDIVTGNWMEANVVYRNRQIGVTNLANNMPSVAIHRPGPTSDAQSFSSPVILNSPTIRITYTLYDPEADQVGYVRAFYSLDGGGHWLPAVAAPGTVTTNLNTSTAGVQHTFSWDTFASNFFGASDNVVFRIQAYPSLRANRNGVPGPYQRPYVSATTFPFRVRGTQVRVALPGTSGTPNPPPTARHALFLPVVAKNLRPTIPVSSSANALVYRLPAGQMYGATPIASGSGQPFRTDAEGYLQGRGALRLGDRLVALLPVHATDTYTLYYTSARPTASGLDAFTVTTPGVQTLTVSPLNPLVLFNLTIALEWDARRDLQFLSQLQFDLARTSELLYDWTNGQAALGQITIYHARQHWDDAHIRIYASNRLRPNAAQGGIVSASRADPTAPTIVYGPGQVHLGPVWNRYGDATGRLGEDWPRVLAHELGHFALFLDDDYLGLDAQGRLIPVDTCTGTAMSDPYRDDFSEFHLAAGWLPGCANTLAQRSSGRADWSTITTFYPWLDGTTPNPGPSGLPLEVTQIRIVAPITPTTTLDAPIFSLSQNGARVQPGASARAVLYQGDQLIDLGRPTLDQVTARGARAGDRLCVYEPAAQRLGCTTTSPSTPQLALSAKPSWQPDVRVTPITTRTITLDVRNLPAGLPLRARLFPTDAPAPSAIGLTPVAGGYRGTFQLTIPALSGYVQVWVEEAAPRREAIADYALGGNPGHIRPRDAPRGDPGHIRPRDAPAISTDGQLILFGDNLVFPRGTFFTVQAATTLPAPPSWATAVGQGYWLSASANAPSLRGVSLSMAYLGAEVPPGEERWLRVYYWDGTTWTPLPTNLDTYHNEAAAPAQGPGLYALMSSIEIPLVKGLNQVAYPVAETRPVREALRSIEGYYTLVRHYDPTTHRWLVFDPAAPDYANTLKVLEFGKGYEITVTQNVIWRLKGAGGTTTASLGPPMRSDWPPAPARFYGVVHGRDGWSPRPGTVVVAQVNGVACGYGQTLEIGGQVVYAIDVDAARPRNSAGCGALGREVTFQIDGRVMRPAAAWDNSQLWAVTLNPQ